jgi:outer membrane beta-barrel protein
MIMISKRITLLLAVLGLSGLGAEARAQDDEGSGSGSGSGSGDDSSDDDSDDSEPADDAGSLDEILKDTTQPSTVNDANDLREGRIDDTKVGVRSDQLTMSPDEVKRKRLIKTLQKKNFVKSGRFEGNIHVGFLANDPFLNRYVGGAAFGYNISEIFELEAGLDFSPDLGTSDWKELTHQLVEENEVSPDISKMTLYGNGSFLFSPIYGKAAIAGRSIINFDMFGAFGMGAARTIDDCEALTACGDDPTEATRFQVHPTTNFGGGVRVIFNQNVAFRLEGRSVVYIETIQATVLEMKQNFVLQGGVSLFFPRMK